MESVTKFGKRFSVDLYEKQYIYNMTFLYNFSWKIKPVNQAFHHMISQGSFGIHTCITRGVLKQKVKISIYTDIQCFKK